MGSRRAVPRPGSVAQNRCEASVLDKITLGNDHGIAPVTQHRLDEIVHGVINDMTLPDVRCRRAFGTLESARTDERTYLELLLDDEEVDPALASEIPYLLDPSRKAPDAAGTLESAQGLLPIGAQPTVHQRPHEIVQGRPTGPVVVPRDRIDAVEPRGFQQSSCRAHTTGKDHRKWVSLLEALHGRCNGLCPLQLRPFL